MSWVTISSVACMKCQMSQWPETGHWLFGVFCWGGGGRGCEVSINGCSVWLVTQDTWKCLIHLILQLCLCMSFMRLVMGLFSFFFLAHTSHQQITAWTSGCSPISCLQMSAPSMPTSATSTRMRLEFLISVLLSHINSLTRAPHVGALLYYLSKSWYCNIIDIYFVYVVCLFGKGRWFDCNIATHTHDQTKKKKKKISPA